MHIKIVSKYDASKVLFDGDTANLSEANLSEANLSWANLERANLTGANLNGANLKWANLSEANLERANLSKASISEANLSKASISEANLSEANLSEANLSWANLERANLTGANLTGANLNGANLERANLKWANLSEADLYGANLSEADLTNTLYDPNKQIAKERMPQSNNYEQANNGWLIGYRTKISSRNIPGGNGKTYNVGCVYQAPIFSVSHRDCDHGLYFCRSLEELRLMHSEPAIKIMFNPEHAIQFNGKARARGFVVLEDVKE